ncbi:serine/arginine repetitive matrix protein 2 [Oscillibacter sp.]|uniref:serine/arginine repetitive matrix protein 2 n=1 Tax=Oscillibacter sp. TaxID=1945593 RepID=UPI0028AD7983|nr:serine/arginine repetitive matrix protein 2 [Oscillibacter sp.]
MEITELYYPQIAVHAGGYTFDRGIRIEVHSSKDSYYDWAKVRFTEEYQEKISLSRKASASVELGYNNVYDETFSGYVAKPYSTGANADEIILKDAMLLLEDLTINDTYLNTTPQEMISHFLSLADITDVSLSPQTYPERKRVPICGLSGVKAISAVNVAWGLKNKFFFSGGTFYWGTAPTQDKVYAFEYGINILSLERSGGEWIIETVSAPFVKHSHKIAVTHPKVTGTFEVSKVVFSTNEDGFIRTYIYFS